MLMPGVKLDQTRAFPRRTHDVRRALSDFCWSCVEPRLLILEFNLYRECWFGQVRSGLTCIWGDFRTSRHAPFSRHRASDTSHAHTRPLPRHSTNTYPSRHDHFSLRTHGVYLSTAFRSPTIAHGRDVLQFRILAISILSAVDIDNRTCAWCTTCSLSIRDPSVSRKVGIESEY